MLQNIAMFSQALLLLPQPEENDAPTSNSSSALALNGWAVTCP